MTSIQFSSFGKSMIEMYFEYTFLSIFKMTDVIVIAQNVIESMQVINEFTTTLLA